MNRSDFERDFPGEFFLSIESKEELAGYLQGHRLIAAQERIDSLSPAGEGNMNCVVRLVTDTQSIIVKQSRPWVEKYPTIAAPRDRVIGEAGFYQAVSKTPAVSTKMPALRLCDKDARVIVLEDLGGASDYSSLYRDGAMLRAETVTELCGWLSALHEIRIGKAADSYANLEMRRLNHEHIFDFPLNPNNGLPLDEFTPGLSAAARELATNEEYVDTVRGLGEIYLGNQPRKLNCLLHGDFFPGSWLDTQNGIRIIDPEFSFYGPPEFDLGVFLAHLHLSGQESSTIEIVRKEYMCADGFCWQLADQFAGVEIMRRLIGVAQLPLQASIDRKRDLLELSQRHVLG